MQHAAWSAGKFFWDDHLDRGCTFPWSILSVTWKSINEHIAGEGALTRLSAPHIAPRKCSDITIFRSWRISTARKVEFVAYASFAINSLMPLKAHFMNLDNALLCTSLKVVKNNNVSMLTVPTSKSRRMGHPLLLENQGYWYHSILMCNTPTRKTKQKMEWEKRADPCSASFVVTFSISIIVVYIDCETLSVTVSANHCEEMFLNCLSRELFTGQKRKSILQEQRTKKSKEVKTALGFHFILFTSTWQLFTVYIAIVGGKSLSRNV